MNAILIAFAKAALKGAEAKYRAAKAGERFDIGGALAKFKALGLKWDIGIYIKCRGPVAGKGTEVAAAAAPGGSGTELTT